MARHYTSARYGPREADIEVPINWSRMYAGDEGRDCKPITSRVGAGRHARITVESGGAHTSAVGDARKVEAEKRALVLAERRAKAAYDTRRKQEASRRQRSRRRPSPRARRSDSESSEERIGGPSYGPPPEPRVERRYSSPPPPPRPRRSRSSRGSSYSPRSPSRSSDFLEYGDVKDYDFNLPIRPKAATYSYVEDVSFPLDADSNGDSGKPSEAAKSRFSGQFTTTKISRSRWNGNAYDRGDLSAEISSPKNGDGETEKRADPLMTWHHLERTAMSLEEFIAAAQGVLQIPEQKRRDVNKLLRDVQRRFEKQRQHGRDLEPNCVSDLYVVEANSGQSGSLMFLSFPYFCLEPYNAGQFKNLTPGTPMHPLRPLLQAHFHSTSQKRELAQAVTTLANTDSGSCLQLSQIWCLIVDGDTILTCGRSSHDTLCGEAITKSEASSSAKTDSVQVSLGRDRSWQIPVDDQTSWPAFLSVFGESIASLEGDGATAGFQVNGTPVGAEQWDFVRRAAQTDSIGLDLLQTDLQKGVPVQMAYAMSDGAEETETHPTDRTTGRRDAQAPETRRANLHAPSEDDVIIQPVDAGVPAVYMIDDSTAGAGTHAPEAGAAKAPEPADTSLQLDNDALQLFKYASEPTIDSVADGLHNVLSTNNREKELAAYNKGGAVKAVQVTQLFQTNTSSSQGSQGSLIQSALYLFRFFWPFHLDHPIADKYWAAVEKLVIKDADDYRAADVDRILEDLNDNVIPGMDAFVRDFAVSKEDIDPLPDAYSKAFLHLIMVFVLLSQTTRRRGFGVNNSTVRAHVKGMKEELSKGKREITSRVKSQMPDLEDLEICSASSLLSLVLNQSSQDVMHGKPDVASTYNDYFARLDFRITEDPTPRSHQETLRFFQQEVEAILSTLQYQLRVLEAFEQSIQQQQSAASGDGNDNFLLRYALGESRQQIVLDSCRARITSRIDKFRGLQQRAQDLGEWHQNAMETNRDRQENAIMVFTIVTIVFLPLSFVSSVFGMNTSDVRDMGYSQWAYWAAAAPLTVLVVVGSLWWAGEFEGFGAWVQKLSMRASSANGYRRGYGRIPEPVGYGRGGREEIDARVERSGARREAYLDERFQAEPPVRARRRTTYPTRRS